MYLNLLTQAQKEAFLALATKVVMADGKVVPEEDLSLRMRVLEMGGNVFAEPEEIYGFPDTAVFGDRRARIICMLELFVLVFSDHHYAPQEREVMTHLQDAFGFAQDEISALKDWARRIAPLSTIGWKMLDSGKVTNW